MFKRFILAVALALAPVATQAQTEASISDVLGSMHLDPAFRQDLRDRGYTGERFEIMVNHTRSMFTDTQIISGLERKIAAQLEANNYRTNGNFFFQLDQTLDQAYDVGLTQLRAGERQLLFQVDSGFVRAIPARDCTRMMSGRMTGERWTRLNDAYLVKLSPAVLDQYYAATRRAMQLGFAPGATPKNLTAQDIRRVEEAIFPQIDTMISRQKNPRAMYDAWRNGDSSGKYACAFNQMFSAAAMNLQDSRRDLALRYLMSN